MDLKVLNLKKRIYEDFTFIKMFLRQLQTYCIDVCFNVNINPIFCPTQQSHDNHKSIYLENNWRLNISVRETDR